MIKFKIYVAFVCVLAIAKLCNAETTAQFTRGDVLRLSWQHPTSREDGTRLNVSEILSFEFQIVCDTDRTIVISDIQPSRNSVTFSTNKILGVCRIFGYTIDSNHLKSKASKATRILIKLPKITRGGFRAWQK